MTRPARAHREAQAAIQSQDADLSEMTEYRRLLQSLQADKAIIKGLNGVSDKIAAKTEMLPRYAEWLSGVIESGQVQSDDRITPTCLIWLIDTGRIDEAIPLAETAIRAGVESSDEYQRSLPEIIIEEAAERIAAGADVSPEHLNTLVAWASGKNESGLHLLNMADQIRAKMLKAAGERAEEAGDTALALSRYRAAVDYNDKIGVKKRIAALEKAA